MFAALLHALPAETLEARFPTTRPLEVQPRSGLVLEGGFLHDIRLEDFQQTGRV